MSSKGKQIWFERELIESKAWIEIRSPSAMKVYLFFLTKRQCEPLKHGDRSQWWIKNNGEITFTYKEAKEKLGISASTFRNAIDELREKGFIDIEESGHGVYKATNKYRISDRWRKYGTDEYEEPEPRKTGNVIRGFKPGNQFGRNCKNTAVTKQQSLTVTS